MQREVATLHRLSDLVAALERAEDLVTDPFRGGKDPVGEESGAGIRELKREVCDILSETEARLNEARSKGMSEGVGE